MLLWCRRAVLALLLILGASLAAQAAERRVALVIGNAQYQHGSAVPAVGANATAMADALRRAGFDVTLARNLDHRGAVAALNRFQEALYGADLGFLYYSGLTLNLAGRNYLIPTDAKLAKEGDVVFDTLELDRVLQDVTSAGRRIVAVFDPSAANPLVERLADAMGRDGRSVRPTLDEPATIDRMFVVYSHRPGTVPKPVTGDGPGPFASALAERMIVPGASFHEALGDTARLVMERTDGAQHPWLRDRLEGGLVLVPTLQPPDEATAGAPLSELKPGPEIALEPMNETLRLTRDTNLRSGPGTSYSVVRVMRNGSEVKATGRVEGGGWLRVEHQGALGFATASNLVPPTSEAPVAEAPPARPPEAPALPTARAMPSPGVYTVQRQATVFARPVLGARGVDMLEPGMTVTVLEAMPEGNWLRVRNAQGMDGFVTASALTAEAEQAPQASPIAPVLSGDLPPPAAVPNPLEGALSGSSNTVEVAALPGNGGATPPPVALGAALTLSPPVQEAVNSARDAAARAATGPSSAAGLARQAQRQAIQAQAEARRTAEIAERGAEQHSVHHFPNGDIYAGRWAVVGGAGRRERLAKEGFGTYRFGNGQVYEGEWRDDTMNGYGVLSFADGERYEGSFQGGLPRGNGVYHFSNGATYTGEIRQGRAEGYGELRFSNGDRYAGMVVNRLPSGYGELTQSDGNRHAGLFRGGIQEGPGAMTNAAGGVQGGQWYGATLLRP